MSYKYRSSNEIMVDMVFRIVDGAWIPIDESNTDYQAYLAWVAEGNEAQTWE